MNDLDYDALYNKAVEQAQWESFYMFPDVTSEKAKQWYSNRRDILFYKMITPPSRSYCCNCCKCCKCN